VAHVDETIPAAYLRISLDLTGEMLGIDRQRDAIHQHCARRGWPAPTEYVDNSVGAWSPRGPGTAYARLIADARARRITAIVVWDLDRLTRAPTEVEDWITICETTGLRLVTIHGDIDTSTEAGRLYLRIMGAVARHEVEHKAARQKAASAQRSARGLPPTGPRAFGWTADGMTLIPAEAVAVADACAALLAGQSLRSIARTWNAAGLTTTPRRPAGSKPGTEKEHTPWAPYSVRGVLANPRIAGLRARKIGRDRWMVVGPGKWPTLVGEETWQAVSATLADPARRTTDQTVRRYLLSGIGVCGVCGAPVTSGGRSRPTVRTYRCGPANHMCRSAEPVDEYVTAATLRVLGLPGWAGLMRPDMQVEAKRLRTELLAKRARMASLADLVADGTLTTDAVRSASARLREEIETAETELADAGRIDVLAGFAGMCAAGDRWREITMEERRTVVAALFEVTILPPGRGARRFDPETVQIRPRGEGR
jgi:DNA invertase Pin-like site-specific DNA recombinase